MVHVPRCPICGRPAKEAFRPFCTRRCADIDLGRWLNEAYVLPDWREHPDDDTEEPEAERRTSGEPPEGER